MSDLRPKGVKIRLGSKEYGMRFTLNAIDEIQEHFDIPVSQLAELFQDGRTQIKNLRYLLTVLINEDIDCVNDETGAKQPHVEEAYVGRHLDLSNMTELMSAIFKAFNTGAPEPEDGDEDDDDPNLKSG
jgi:hypothetical protein